MHDKHHQSQFELTSREALDEAAEWLQDAGFHIAVNDSSALRPGRQQLLVFHDVDYTREVRRIVFLVDPRAMERRLAPRGG